MVEAINAFISHPLVWLAILGGLGGLIYWKGQVDSDLSTLKAFMTEIRADIKSILERVRPVTVAAGSPLQLTGFGKTIAESFGAEDWARESVSSVATPNEMVVKEPYQIDELCNEYVQNKIASEEYNRVQGCAYKHGIEPNDVLQVLRVVLRDQILNSLQDHFRCLDDDPDKLWHFAPSCPQWPLVGFDVSLKEPTVGRYCPMCEQRRPGFIKHTPAGSSDDDIPF